MTITAQQKALVQDSFAQVLPIADQAAAIFYDRLFSLDPSLRPLFSENMNQQRVKLMQTLNGAVMGLDDLDALVPILENLAIRHVGYGVRDEHYQTVGAALIWTLEQGLGHAFTDEVRAAWQAVYGIISHVMINATKPVPA
ncbi:MAG: globin family protein [Chloroflexota bacterium]